MQQARELLAPVYGRFTEGFDTRDLKEAKALARSVGVVGLCSSQSVRFSRSSIPSCVCPNGPLLAATLLALPV